MDTRFCNRNNIGIIIKKILYGLKYVCPSNNFDILSTFAKTIKLIIHRIPNKYISLFRNHCLLIAFFSSFFFIIADTMIHARHIIENLLVFIKDDILFIIQLNKIGSIPPFAATASPPV